MLTQDQLRDVIGTEAYASNGDKLGKIEQVYVDDMTQQPEFATVNTGLFGTKENFVPLGQATFSGERLTVPVDKDQVKEAPKIDPDGHIEPDEVAELYRHYGLQYDGPVDPTQRAQGQRPTDVAATPTAAAGGTDAGDDAMTRSEEQLHVGKRDEEVGRARLRKYVVTENVTTTVPVREERAVVEREPITGENRDRAFDGADLTESEHEVVLHRETPVVTKETQPVERVRLGTEEVSHEETVSEQVRKEQIEAEGDVSDS